MSELDRIIALRKIMKMGITTIPQFVALRAIKYQPGIGTAELAKVIGLKRSAVDSLAQRLIEKGLVMVSKIDWKKQYDLTDLGKKAVEEGRKS